MTEFEKDLFDLTSDWAKYKESNFIEKYKPKQLPVIPRFVANQIEELKGYNASIWAFFDMANGEIKDWLHKGSTVHSEFVVRAWLDGYTIEEEKKFRLKLSNTYLSQYLWLNQAQNKVFMDKKTKEWTNHDNVKNVFTEEEITKISEGAFVNNKAFEKEEVIE